MITEIKGGCYRFGAEGSGLMPNRGTRQAACRQRSVPGSARDRVAIVRYVLQVEGEW